MNLIRKKESYYKDIYLQLNEKLKWKVSDKRTLFMVASLYTVNGKDFDIARYLTVCDYIKEKVEMFSTLKSYQRFTTAAMLDIPI